MISSDVSRGYNDTMILFILLKEKSYGYEISKQIRQKSGEQYAMKETTLYSAFTRLEKNGFIKASYGDESFGTRRTYYEITPLGLEYYKEKCREWLETKEIIENFIMEEFASGHD